MESIPIDLNSGPKAVLELIYRLKVGDVMSRDLATAAPDASLRDIRSLMRDRGISGVPVVEGTRLIGLVTIENILEALDGGWIDQSAQEHMTRSVIVLEADMPLTFAITYLNRYGYRRFPVLDKNGALSGIVSAKDIIRALLVEMNHEVERLEEGLAKAEPAPENTSAHSKSFSFPTRHWDFETAGRASAALKSELKKRGVDPAVQRRASVTSYELELNQVIHSDGGVMEFEVGPDKTVITARDTGPGIANLESALTEGFSTANEWIRSLGFGAGLNLPNARKSSNEFSIESAIGKGTTVIAVILHTPKTEPGSPV
ncbi:MAG TPA: CBS domain-containing protein [Spirochaetales bacterium]|nr:CBS domain-containing protein [Spirochaetales bacterium]